MLSQSQARESMLVYLPREFDEFEITTATLNNLKKKAFADLRPIQPAPIHWHKDLTVQGERFKA